MILLKIFSKTKWLLLAFLFCENIALSAQDLDLENYFYLSQWEINLGQGWQKTNAISWQTGPAQGGIGATQHHGFGVYRTRFNIPPNFRNMVLAFYTDCIDDADQAFLNGHLIGQTGQIPEQAKNKSFRSGTREPRFYILPERFINFQEQNELQLRVFDYSGIGGFCYPQEPVVGGYSFLIRRAANHRAWNDIPRIIVLIFLIIIVMVYSSKTYLLIRKKTVSLGKVLSRLLWSFWPWANEGKIRRQQDFDLHTEMIFKYLLLSLMSLLYFIFLLSEVPYKYWLTQSEEVWFQLPAVALSMAYLLNILFYHRDVFGSSLAQKNGILKRIFIILLYIITSPLLFLIPVIYLFFTSPQNAWSFFVTSCLSLMMVISSCLFFSTAINLVYVGMKSGVEQRRRKLLKEGVFRIGLFVAQISGIALFLSSTRLSEHSFLIGSIFITFFVFSSSRFYQKTGINLPLSTKLEGLKNILKQKYRLTSKEIEVCRLFNTGYNKEQVLSFLNVNYNALKFHLKNIYSKTIDMEEDFSADSNYKKFPGLLIFLRNLSQK